MEINNKAKLLLKGEKPELVELWPEILGTWPDRKQVEQAVKKLGYDTVRYIGKNNIMTLDMRQDRLSIFFDENNKIYDITRG